MAQQEFGPDKDLLVVEDERTVRFITRGHDQEELDHDEVRKLIAFLQVIVGKDDTGAYTPAALEALPEGAIVRDEDGDEWEKKPDGAWHCSLEDVYAGSTLLARNYGPIRGTP